MRMKPIRALLLLLLAEAMAGCPTVGVRPDQPPPPEPGPQADLTYVLRLRNPASPAIEIQVSFQGAQDGQTTLSLSPHWGGVRKTGDEIRSLAATCATGAAAAVERPEPHRFVLRHPPGDRLRVHYLLVSPNLPLDMDDPSRRPYHHPIVSPGLFHLIGPVGLLYPEHLYSGAKLDIAVRWEGFAEAGWSVASSYGLDPSGARVRLELEQFRYGLFVAGHLRLLQRKLRHGTLAMTIHGQGWGFSDTAFLDLAARILETERAFFADTEEGFFLVNLLPVGPKREGFRGMSGTGLTQAFALFMTPNFDLQPDSESARQVQQLLAHELFHHWLGGIIVVDQPETLHYWFSEGFTTHYTRKVLARAGLLPLRRFVDELNEQLLEYMQSPVRNANNQVIEQDFWNREEVHDLPYLRGDLLALRTDHEIRKASKGKKTLDDLMRAVLAKARAQRLAFDNQALFALIEGFTSKEFAAEARRVVDQGASVVLPAGTLSPCLRLVERSIGPFDLGFDFTAGRETKRVQGVKPGSAAFLAGLRDGQKLLGWSVRDRSPLDPVRFTVQDGPRHLDVSYLPQGEKHPVPQFEIADPKACRDIP